jgi:hypothetical protein
LKGKRAKEWGLIDDYFPTTRFQTAIDARVSELIAANTGQQEGPGITLNPLRVEASANAREYNALACASIATSAYADLTVRGRQAICR